MDTKFSARDYFSAPEQKNLFLLLVVTGTFAFIAASFLYFSYNGSLNLKDIFSKQSFDIVFSNNAFPAGPLTQTKGKTTFFPTVEGQGTAVLVGKKMVSTTTQYVLLKDPVTSVTNLYKQNLLNTKIGLQQLTNSNTQKADLYVDRASGSATYITEAVTASTSKAVPIPLTSSTTMLTATTTSHVVVYDSGMAKEIDLGVGTNPYLLPGGFFAVYRKGNSLVSVDVHHATSNTLALIPKQAIFTVDPAGFQLAVYHPEAKNIQLYSIQNLISVEFKKSLLSSTTPLTLTFEGRDLKGLYIKDHTFVLTNFLGKEEQGPQAANVVIQNKSVMVVHD